MTDLEAWLDEQPSDLQNQGEIEFHGGVLRWSADRIQVEPVAMEGFQLSESAPGTVNLYRTTRRPAGVGILARRGVEAWLLVEIRDPRGRALRLASALPDDVSPHALPLSNESSSAVDLEQMAALLQMARQLGVQMAQLNLSALEDEPRRVVGAPVQRTGKATGPSSPESSGETREGEPEQQNFHHLRDRSKSPSSSTVVRLLGLALLVAMLMAPAWMPASCCIQMVGGDWVVTAVGHSGDYLVIGARDSTGNVTAHMVTVVSLEDGSTEATEFWSDGVWLWGTGPDYVWINEVGDIPVALSVPELEELYSIEDDLFEKRPDLQDLWEDVSFTPDGLAVIDARDGNYYLVDPRSGEVTSSSTRIADADILEPGDCPNPRFAPKQVGERRLFEVRHLCDRLGDNGTLVEFRALEGRQSKLLVALLDEEREDFVWVKGESDWLEERDPDETGRRIYWSGTHEGNVIFVMDDGADVDEIHVLAVSEADGEPVWSVTID